MVADRIPTQTIESHIKQLEDQMHRSVYLEDVEILSRHIEHWQDIIRKRSTGFENK
jgi:hypothetical protein